MSQDPKRSSTAYPPMAESKALKEAFLARKAKLDFDREAGRLIDVEVVKREAFETAQRLRTLLMAIPGRLSSSLAKETSEHRIEELLNGELLAVFDAMEDEDAAAQ